MGESSQEKTEQATPKRLRDARKKGDVPKSKDLSTVAVMIIVFATIAMSAGFMAGEFKMLMANAFGLVAKGHITYSDMMMVGEMSLVTMAKVLGPTLIAGVASAAIIGYLQVGGMFTAEPLKPKIEKLNPIEGFKNMFKLQTFIELIKNMIKLSLVIYVAYQTINSYLEEILLSSKVTVIESVSLTGAIVYSFFVKVAILFLVVALIDMGIQRWNYAKKHRMSKDEVKREYKQDEGDPQIKGERRRIHREMVFGDARQNVKKADAVVSNPQHVAVAIQYNRAEMGAPEVTIKGQRKFAELILQIAREEGIPIIRNIPLAWSLLKVEIGDAIPEELYEPVAEVLSMVYDIKEGKTAQAQEQQKQAERPSTFNPLG
ncbi:MAG: type III secretion system export apparatus subunit SctU [Deltaproteobacteria bacterium]|nr:type III secretion system export apparatus subunit SctU [Deltaproteobacteria bacterium]